jgi:O-acetyl-ADP-ribose deacetylase (regulator of RNase III)
MKRLGWIIKALSIAICRLNFLKKFFEIYLPLNISLEQYAKPFAPLSEGQAILTPAFNLKANHVAHTVCPRFYDGQIGEQQGLRDAYSNALEVCNELDWSSTIAFVAMGTGVYKWPIELAADIAISMLRQSTFRTTVMCLHNQELLKVYRDA